MKKILLTLVLLISVSFVKVAHSQDFKFGVKAGVNLSTMNYEKIYGDKKIKYGFQLGGLAEYSFNENIAVEADVLLSLQGVRGESSGTCFDRKVNQNAYYINIPLMFKWYIIDKVSVSCGPQLGIVLSAKDKITESLGDEGEDVSTVNINNRYNATDFSLCLAAYYYFSKSFFAGARYAHGLTNLYKGYDLKSKNRVLTIGIGYIF